MDTDPVPRQREHAVRRLRPDESQARPWARARAPEGRSRTQAAPRSRRSADGRSCQRTERSRLGPVRVEKRHGQLVGEWDTMHRRPPAERLDQPRRSRSVNTTSASTRRAADCPSERQAHLSTGARSRETAASPTSGRGRPARASPGRLRATGRNWPMIRYSSWTTSGCQSSVSRRSCSPKPAAVRSAAHVGTPRSRAARSRTRFASRSRRERPTGGISTSRICPHRHAELFVDPRVARRPQNGERDGVAVGQPYEQLRDRAAPAVAAVQPRAGTAPPRAARRLVATGVSPTPTGPGRGASGRGSRLGSSRVR